MVWPSGEKVGKKSSPVSGGEVSRRRSPFATETRKMLRDPLGVSLSATANSFPSGDESNCRANGRRPDTGDCKLASLRSCPPNADTSKIPGSLPARRNTT